MDHFEKYPADDPRDVKTTVSAEKFDEVHTTASHLSFSPF